MDSIQCNSTTVTSGPQSVMLPAYAHTPAKFAAVYSTVHLLILLLYSISCHTYTKWSCHRKWRVNSASIYKHAKIFRATGSVLRSKRP